MASTQPQKTQQTHDAHTELKPSRKIKVSTLVSVCTIVVIAALFLVMFATGPKPHEPVDSLAENTEDTKESVQTVNEGAVLGEVEKLEYVNAPYGISLTYPSFLIPWIPDVSDVFMSYAGVDPNTGARIIFDINILTKEPAMTRDAYIKNNMQSKVKDENLVVVKEELLTIAGYEAVLTVEMTKTGIAYATARIFKEGTINYLNVSAASPATSETAEAILRDSIATVTFEKEKR